MISHLQTSGYSRIELELAHFRGLLKKKYANDHDGGYTYIDPATGDSVPLTLFMMKEWCRAMVCTVLLIMSPSLAMTTV